MLYASNETHERKRKHMYIKRPAFLSKKPAMPVLTDRAEHIFKATGAARVKRANASAPTFAYVEAGSFAIAVECLKKAGIKHAATYDDNLGGHVITLQ
jgi:hypothetical protein